MSYLFSIMRSIKKGLIVFRNKLLNFQLKNGLYFRGDLPKYERRIIDNVWRYRESACVRSNYKYKKDTIDVSVIVPLFNSYNYLPSIMDDLLSQKISYSYEIILINDGSKDETDAVCREYVSKYGDIVSYFVTENNGISAARNIGIENARGRFLAFVDHDDRVSENYLQELLCVAKEADIVNCIYAAVLEGEKKYSKLSDGYIWGGLYRKSLFNKVRFPEGFWYEDMINHVLLYKQASKIISVNKEIYYYTLSRTQASKIVWRKNHPQSIDQLYLIEGLCKDYNLLGFEDDEYLFNMIICECSSQMVNRTKGLSEKIRKQIFCASRELVMSKYKKEYIVKENYKEWLMIFLNGDYSAWKIKGICEG